MSASDTALTVSASDSAILAEEKTKVDNILFFPPLNFGWVENQLYRSAYPNETNISFLKTLNLRTIIMPGLTFFNESYFISLIHYWYKFASLQLCNKASNNRNMFIRTISLFLFIYISDLDETSSVIGDFAIENRVNLIPVQKEGGPSSSELSEDAVFKSLNILLDSSNYPVLVTCKYGRNFSGVIVGCLRKLQRWSLMSIFEEFRRFSGSRQQHHEQFIELFDTELLDFRQESRPPFLK